MRTHPIHPNHRLHRATIVPNPPAVDTPPDVPPSDLVPSDVPPSDVPPSDVPPLSPVLDSLRILWALNHRLEVASSRMLRTIGVTAQQRMLLRIVQRLEPVPAGTLARALHIHPGTLSASLRRLEERGYLVRRRDSADARRVTVSLTAAGLHIATHLEGTVEECVAGVLDQSSPGDVTVALAFLRTLSDALANQR